MANYSFVLPFALGEDGAHVLLGERTLIQTKFAGRTNRTPNPLTDLVPEWAGQWTLIGGPVNTGETAQKAAVRHFQAQAGLDLSDPAVQTNFLLGNQGMVTAKTADYQPLNVLCVFTTLGGLDLLNTTLGDTIGTSQCTDGVLSKAACFPVVSARQKLGALAPPPDGWRTYVVQEYYGGKPPGQLNTDIDVITRTLTERSAQADTLFAAALDETD